MTIPEFAERLAVPESWVRDQVTARKIPHIRVGRHVRFSEEQLRELIRAGEQPALNTPPRPVIRRVA